MESIFDLETGAVLAVLMLLFRTPLLAVLGAEAAGRKPRYYDGEQGSFPLK